MKIRISIFTKLFLIIIATAVLVNMLIGAYFTGRFRLGRGDSYIRNVDVYAGYLIRDLGYPPDPKAGAMLSARTAMNIAVEGRGVRWSTAPVPPPPPPADRKGIHPTPGGFLGFHRGMFFYMTERNGYRYYFWSRRKNFPGDTDPHFYLFLGIISALMAGAYLLIRRLLKPVALLSRGVKETSAGNLDHRIPVTSRDELGSLSASFNTMNERIGRMLKSREQLLLDVSHELRSPLTRIKVALEFLPDEPARESIREDVAVIDGMVGEILESQRLDHLEGRINRQPLDAAALVHAVLKEFALPEGRVTVDFTETPLTVHGDRERLKTVFRNIIGNALKYTDPGAGSIRVGGNRDGDTTRIFVHDRGPGIPTEELDEVFEPFYRVDRSRSRNTGGYGLGLHICKKIMEAHEGSISIESIPGEGTSVVLIFPVIK